MIRKKWYLICFVLVMFCSGLLSCKSTSPEAPPPEPTRVVLEIESSADINPNADGRPSPVVLRIYRLKSAVAFTSSDFFSLFEKDKKVLGDDFLGKKEIVMEPDDHQTIFFEPDEEVTTLGVFVAYRNYEESQWWATTGLMRNKFNLFNIKLSGITVDIQ